MVQEFWDPNIGRIRIRLLGMPRIGGHTNETKKKGGATILESVPFGKQWYYQ